MINREILGKSSILVLYSFIISLTAAFLHIIFDSKGIQGQYESGYYFVIPLIIGLNILMSWSAIKLNLRVNIDYKGKENTNINILVMFIITVCILSLRINEIVDTIISVSIISYISLKVIILTTKYSPFSHLSEETRMGIMKSKYFFWSLKNVRDLEFMITPNACNDLKIHNDIFENKLVLKNKSIRKPDIEKHEKDFNKTMFDFNKDDLMLVDMIEI